MNVLVVGGAGVTGVVIVRELLKRACSVTILHRGAHEPDLPEEVVHIHTDPYSLEALQEALEGRSYDLAIITYGRLKYVAQALEGKTDRIISVGGAAPIYKGWGKMTAPNPWETTEPTPLFLGEDHPLSKAEDIDRFSAAVRKTEQMVMQMHHDGIFNVTHFRYPLVYGPNNIVPGEWGIMRRVRDRQKPLILPGGGLTLVSKGYCENIAHAVLLAVEDANASAGQIYNICDNALLSNHEWVTLIGRIMNFEFDTVDIPYHVLPKGFRATHPQLLYRHHSVMDISKIKEQLGYRDPFTAEEAIERTIKWYTDNPLPPGGEGEQNLGDPFDYSYEEAIIAAYRKHSESLSAEIAEMPHIPVTWKHPYLS